MKQYYGNYLGLCINNDDKQKRGRVQIFIPHIMPALYENWNEVGEDIQMLCVGDNLPNSLTSDMVNKLTKMLPWAEAASPIIGTSAPGNLVNGNYDQSPVPNAGNNSFPYTIPPNGAAGGGVSQNHAGKQRGGALGESLVKTIARGLAGTGLNWESTSGTGTASGQATGSYHTSGQATDGVFRDAATNRILDPNNSDDQGRIAYALNRLSNAGIGGIGWGNDYMGASTFHLDIGPPNRNWGSSYTRSTAAPWIVSARQRQFSESVAGTTGSTSGQVAGTPLIDSNPISLDLGSTDYATLGRPEVSFAPVALNLDGSPASAAATAAAPTSPGGLYSDNLINFLKQDDVEGFDPKPYEDGSQVSIGYGTRAKTGETVGSGITITRQEAELRLRAEIDQAAADANRIISNENISGLTQSQLEALYSYTYNRGPEGLIELLNNSGSDWNSISANMLKYFAGEKIRDNPNNIFYNGLINRRKKEITYANGGAGAFQPSTLVNHPDPNGPTAVVNINNMAKGVFSYPAAGALLWVFFREGDPNFPVYFAASFGESEWQSAYRQGSEVDGYSPASTPDKPATSTGARINLDAGGISSTNTTVPGDPTKDQKTFTIYGYDGSNMHFNEGYHQIFTKFDRRDQVEGDRWETTLGYKERWIQGDDDKVVMGNVYVKVGNVSQTAVDAVNRIQEIIGEIMQPLAGDSSEQTT